MTGMCRRQEIMSVCFDSPQLKTTFSTDSRVQNMFEILLDDEMEKDKREKVSILSLLAVFFFFLLFVGMWLNVCGFTSANVYVLLCLGCQ